MSSCLAFLQGLVIILFGASHQFDHVCHVYAVLGQLKLCSQLGFRFHDSTYLKVQSISNIFFSFSKVETLMLRCFSI